jgi:IS30 family transposase
MQKWRDILIDFIVDLPSSNGFTNIMVVVDRLMKMRYMVPIDSINAVSVAECFVKYVFKLHRLPNSIVSDCGS